MDIKLTFKNESQDANNSSVVIFQKNVGESQDKTAVAWKTIKNCGAGDYHSFTFPVKFEVGATDSNGNSMPTQTATPGEMYEVDKDDSGHILRKTSQPASSPNEVELRNNLSTGPISATIYRDGKLLAMKKFVGPQEKATFKFLPTIWIGVVSEIEEGDIIDSAVIEMINTELSLLGISSADIVMTGGGGGSEATPFNFSLQNVKTI